MISKLIRTMAYIAIFTAIYVVIFGAFGKTEDFWDTYFLVAAVMVSTFGASLLYKRYIGYSHF